MKLKLFYLRVLVLAMQSTLMGGQGMGQTIQSIPVDSILSQTIPLTYHKMTNILFPCAIRPVVKVSRDIQVQKVKGVANVLLLKAARKGFSPTNLSVYGEDGHLYSFELRYAEDPLVLNFRIGDSKVLFSGLPTDPLTMKEDASRVLVSKGFIHRSVHKDKLALTVRGIYLKDGVEWMVLTLRNGSVIPYAPEHLRCYIRNRRALKRTVIQEMPIEPLYTGNLPIVTSGVVQSFALGFRPLALTRHKELILQIGEGSGERQLIMEISSRTLLKARKS